MGWSLFEKRIVIIVSSRKHWIPCSMVFQGLCCSWRSSGQRYLSFTLVKSHIQRLRGSGLAIPWSIPTSRDRDSKCLTSVLSKIEPSPAVSQTLINQLNIDSLGHWVRSFLRLQRLSMDKDSVIISGSDSSAGCEGPASPSSSTRQMVLYFLLWTGLGCPSGLTAA